MSLPQVRLNGIDEGFEVKVRTRIRGAEDAVRIQRAFDALFPDAPETAWPPSPSFPTLQDETVTVDHVPLDTFLLMLREQRILDTALDAMTRHLAEDSTWFEVERVAALAGKVSFGVPDHSPLGGTFRVEVSGPGLNDWILAATHHQGRSTVPRSIGDERAMSESGEAQVWFER